MENEFQHTSITEHVQVRHKYAIVLHFPCKPPKMTPKTVPKTPPSPFSMGVQRAIVAVRAEIDI